MCNEKTQDCRFFVSLTHYQHCLVFRVKILAKDESVTNEGALTAQTVEKIRLLLQQHQSMLLSLKQGMSLTLRKGCKN